MPAANPRGNMLERTVKVLFGDWAHEARVPVLVVHIDSTAANRRALRRFCEFNGIFCKEVHFARTAVAFAFEVDGLPEALELLLEQPYVTDAYHAVTGVRVPTVMSRAAGGGTLTERAQRELRVHPLHGPQVPAVERKADEQRAAVTALPTGRRAALDSRYNADARMAELLALNARAETLTPAERARAERLMAELGID